MQRIKEKIKSLYIPINTGSLALFISILAIGYVASATNTPCLNAQSTCAIGDTNEFSNEIAINSANYKGTLSATNNTSNQTYTFPNATGTIALTSDIPSVPTLTASKIMATDGTGAYSTTDIYPLSVGTTGQVLTVNSGATALEYSSITGVPSLTASKSVATDGAGALTTTNVYPLTLTASTPLKTNVSGEVTASDLDITTDITPGTALQEIRVNSGGTALEYFTPSSSGGRWTLVGQGQMSQSSYTMGVCWYDDTQGTGIGGGLDQTKVYKLVVEPTGSMGTMGNNSSYPAMVAMNETNCSNIASSGNYLFSSSVTNNGFWVVDTQGWHASFNSYVNAPWLGYQQHTTSNSSSSKCGGASITMIIRNGIGNVSVQNTKNEGVKFTDIKSAAPCYDSGNNLTGWQQADSSGITWDSSQSYAASPVDNMNQMTGIQFKGYDGGGGFSQPVWYLYESDY